ncbi:MAG: AAA family ATPase [Planctomycetes bacterium]|nr:AAA family ATPase [Planctomycetota bacterium]
MYVKRIVLENVRGFRELDFSLERPDGPHAGWTVFTGDNGSGKSALLKAMAVALGGPDSARSLQESFRGWTRSGEREGVIALELIPTEGDDGFQDPGRTKFGPFWAELHVVNGGKEPLLQKGVKHAKKGRTAHRGPWADQPTGWFSCGYGPFRRTSGTSPGAQRLMVGPSRVARFVTLFREDASLSECENWLKELKFRQTEARQEDADKLALVQGMLNDDLLQNGLRVDHVDSEGLWLRDRANIVLPMADMSDGYRAALALMADILRHLIEVYGLADLTMEQDGRTVVKRSGVVLVDEIDAHLHPEWQRRIGFWLKQHMPRIQFLVTTHSPLICQAADPGGLFRLPEPGSNVAPFALGEDDRVRIVAEKPNVILLSPAFGLKHTRSPVAVRNRERYAELAAKKASVGLTPQEEREGQKLLPYVADSESWGHQDAQDTAG